MSVTLIGNKLQVEVLADESTKTQLNEIQQEVGDLDERVDTIIAGTVEGVSGAEIVDARDGETVLLNKLQKMNFGEVGKNYKIVAGAIRNSGSGWEFINDLGHEPINCLSVETLADSIKINYNFTGKKSISFIAVPDEALARKGFFMGSSVHNTYAEIFLRKQDNVSGYLTKSGGASPTFSITNNQGIVSATWGESGLIVEHEKVYNYSGIHAISRTPGLQCIVNSMDGLGTKTQFRFYDNTNTLVNPINDGTVILFNRVGGGNVPPADVDYPYSNIWFYGIMEVE